MKRGATMQILTDAEKMTIRSMAAYWNEVAKRDSASTGMSPVEILRSELRHLENFIGTKILFVVADYVKQEDENVKIRA
jgi:hypothetical protein